MLEVLQYDLLTNNLLFEGQSPSKPEKHNIVTKLENILEIKSDFENLDDTFNVLVVDFMSLLRLFTDEIFAKFSGPLCCRMELY